MNNIEILRGEIAEIDAQLISLMAKRQQVSKKVGEYKKQNNIPVVDITRENLLREFHNDLCLKNDLSSDMITTIFNILIEESRKVQSNE